MQNKVPVKIFYYLQTFSNAHSFYMAINAFSKHLLVLEVCGNYAVYKKNSPACQILLGFHHHMKYQCNTNGPNIGNFFALQFIQIDPYLSSILLP